MQFFHNLVNFMKFQLDAIAYKLGKPSADFDFYKATTMDHCWKGLQETVARLAAADLVERCPCGARPHHGRTGCPCCGGLGHRLKG